MNVMEKKSTEDMVLMFSQSRSCIEDEIRACRLEPKVQDMLLSRLKHFSHWRFNTQNIESYDIVSIFNPNAVLTAYCRIIKIPTLRPTLTVSYVPDDYMPLQIYKVIAILPICHLVLSKRIPSKGRLVM